ncbi:MAG TPA: GNAT family N-acetyltransferase, partial [Chthoniobacterales bacterium]|nr:GNAT family N-acetyltransferase [Chthoniobacterales bacterium]
LTRSRCVLSSKSLLMKPTIALAETSDSIRRCYECMRELRTHLQSEEEFVQRVHRQQGEGFRLAYLEAEGAVRSVAGYRIYELLFSGRTLYVDDLSTRAADRSRGYGGELFDWLVEEARRENCHALTLDSGVQRFDAHRFYLMKRMKISAHHFTLEL